MESNKKILDNKYIIEQRLGSGGEGIAYLVKDKDSTDPELKLVAKILEFEGNENEEEYEKDESIKEKIKHTIQIFEKVRSMSPPHPNVIRCYTQNKGKIVRDGKLLKNRNYFIFEYAPKGDLWKITQLAGGFGERCAKPIFQKILLGVQALHNSGIYHLDLKVDNIILDNDYNPKICDFGFATLKNGILTDEVGTRNYKPPQMFENPIKYTGEKADIFSLGCILFALVAKGPWFYEAKANDDCYKYIYRNKIEDYFNMLSAKTHKVNTLTKEFKDLYIKMIAYKEKDRPSIKDILNDVWFNEIRNLNDEAKLALDNEIRAQFLEKEKRISQLIGKFPHILDQIETFPTDTRGVNGSKRKPTFKNDINPKYKKFEFVNDNHYIQLKGKINLKYFMNKLIDNIINEYGEDNIEVIASNYKYKCDLVFIENNNNEENKNNDNEEEDADKEESNENKCTIQLKLYKTGEEEFCLRFLRKLGNLPQYYLIIKKIFELARNFI